MFKKQGFFFVHLLIVPSLYSIVNFGYGTKENHFINNRNAIADLSKNVPSELTGKGSRDGTQAQSANHPPVVKITAPQNNSVYEWNATVPYTISVSDPEDGESKFDEISSNEVFLEVKYVTDVSKAAAAVKQAVKSDPAGLGVIKTSNCLNCHAFTTKLIGPSFYDITKRYAYTNSNIELLTKRIREGSTGVWGNVTMPTHPELSKEETQSIVQWILKNAKQPDLNYYRGLEGSFRLKPPVSAKKNGVYVLTARYTDHGLKDKPNQSLTGQDVIIIKGK